MSIEIDNKLSELRQNIWIELWGLDDASVILENDSRRHTIILASQKSDNRLNLDYPEELADEITPIFLETLRQEFVNAKVIDTDYKLLMDEVAKEMQRIEGKLLGDYNEWKEKVNKVIERINKVSLVLNEQVQRSE